MISLDGSPNIKLKLTKEPVAPMAGAIGRIRPAEHPLVPTRRDHGFFDIGRPLGVFSLVKLVTRNSPGGTARCSGATRSRVASCYTGKS